MSNINSVVVSGNLTADPEIKMAGAEGDFAIVNLRMAVNRSKKNKESGDYEDETSYFDVTVFGSFGELADRKLRKGDPLTVSGRLEQQRWESEGGNRSKVVIIASDIDAQAFFKKVEDIKPKVEGGDTATGAGQPVAADDDIPF